MSPHPPEKPSTPLAPLWFMLGTKRGEETIVVLGIKPGPAADARELMVRRATEEGVGEYEMFNLLDPIPRVRDEVAGWLIAAGASVEDARESSVSVLKSIAEALKRTKPRRGARGER
jgi:hypothetical protein